MIKIDGGQSVEWARPLLLRDESADRGPIQDVMEGSWMTEDTSATGRIVSRK